MPDATITSTASTFGTIAGTFAADQSTITGTITAITGTVDGSVGVPGPQGPAGAAGVGVPAAGTTGQVLQKLSATSYDTGWLTLPADYITSVTAPLAVTSGNLSVNLSAYLPLAGGYITGDIQSNNGSGYRTFDGLYSQVNISAANIQLLNGNVGGGTLTVEWDGITFADGKQTVKYPGASILTGYALESWVTAGFYPLSGNPSGFLTDAPSNGSQYARKNAAWDVVIPGDRYLTTSTTSNTINNANKTFTIGTGLSYTPTQNITISYDASNHMHGEVLTYNSGTGVLTVDIKNHTGSGTYAAWVVNVGGVTPATSVAWGAITGTLSTQTDLQNALNLKLDVTTAASTYYLQTNPSGFIDASALTPYAPLAGATFTGKVNMAAPTAGSASLNLGVGTAPTTSVAGDIWIAANINFRASDGTLKGVANTNTVNTFSQPQIIQSPLATTTAALRVTQLGTGNAIEVEDSTTPDATRFVVDQFGKVGIGVAPDTTAALNVDNNGIKFGDGTTQTTAATAGIPDAPSDGSTYGRNNGAWAVAGGGGANIQTFTTAGTATWTKPSGKTMAWIRIFGGGGGGGSGARQAAGTAKSGGGGGQAGGMTELFIPLSALGATETVTVGAGGAGGVSASTNTSVGNAGGPGGQSSIGNYKALMNAAAGGGGGTTVSGAGGVGASANYSFNFVNYAAAAASVSGGAGSASTGAPPSAIESRFFVLPTGGGGGAGGLVTPNNGGAGGTKPASATTTGIVASVAGGSGGTTLGALPTAGTSGVANYQGGTGGGGGAYIINVAGMAGANGGQPSGGGGGGAASYNGFASGAGGDGGDGMVIVVCY